MNNSSVTEQTSGPWWRFGIVWLVVGGPAVVVVAATVTAFIAIVGADPPVDRTQDRMSAQTAAPGDAEAPAVQARNHAATARAASKEPLR